MKIKIVLAVLLFLSLSANAWLLISIRKNQEFVQTLQDASSGNKDYRYTKPLGDMVLDGEGSQAILHYVGLKPSIEKVITNNTENANVGFFLQDIATGAWLGINEQNGFFPASLLKIPIMMAILKKVETGEMKFTDEIALINSDLDKGSGTLYEKGTGYKANVWNLLEEMILMSDNTAKNALKRQLTDAEINAVFTHVGIPNPYKVSVSDTVSARGYIRLFKSLYYSTYINRELSEKALGLTTDTRYDNLLKAGVPLEVPVAHKYGVSDRGVSDCGIIYYARSPYFLCIMIKDVENKKAQDMVANMSKLVFDYVLNKETASESAN